METPSSTDPAPPAAPPRHGLLSGMALTWVTAAAAVVVGYCAVQPLVLLAFFLEHRRWLARARILDAGAALP